MKHFIFVFGMIFMLVSAAQGQGPKELFFNEIAVSVNRTALQDDNTYNRFGFGFGAYRAFTPDKKLNFVFGMEFNQTSQFKKHMYEGRFQYATNLTYKINCWSIPVGLRINFGTKTKILIEGGGYADLVLGSNRTGTMHISAPDENNHIKNSKVEIDANARLGNVVGLYFGLGIRIPISGFEIIVKPAYKFGINSLYSYHDDVRNSYFKVNIGLKENSSSNNRQ